MRRLSTDEIFMAQAIVAAGGSTCRRRSVGCVLVDRHNYILSVGRNGVPRGVSHCLDSACPGASLASGTGLEACESVHAEQSALIHCKDPQAIKTCYVTASPCAHCVKMLMNTSCEQVVFLEPYPSPSSLALWLSRPNPGEWVQLYYSKFLQEVAASVANARLG